MFVIVLCLLIGLYLPTSFGPEPSMALVLVANVLCVCLFSLLIIRRPAHHILFPLAVIIPVLVALFSFTSGLPRLTLVALGQYLVLAPFLLVRMDDLAVLNRFSVGLFDAVNSVNLFLGFSTVLGFGAVNDFLIAHYSAAYPELVQNMVTLHKPVMMFWTHSFAAFMLYLFFYCCVRTFEVSNKKKYLLYAIAYLLLILCLTSVAGLLMFLIGAAHITWLLWSKGKRIAPLAVVACVCLMPLSLSFIVDDWPGALDFARSVMERQDSGLIGRYVNPDSLMHENLRFISEHPFTPVGASFKEGFMFGDSGPVEHFLRGSLPLVILVYGGFWLFIRANIKSKRDRVALLLLCACAEIGLNFISIFRFQLLILPIAVYLNSLSLPWPEPYSPIKKLVSLAGRIVDADLKSV